MRLSRAALAAPLRDLLAYRDRPQLFALLIYQCITTTGFTLLMPLVSVHFVSSVGMAAAIVGLALARAARRDIFADYGHPDIMQWAKWVKSVAREKHRMEAFVRFEALADGRYLARIAPDFDVLPLIARHFQKRYPDMRWGIYDEARRYGICHENGTLHQLAEIAADAVPAEQERHYQVLWQSYFHSASIASRRNLRLHRQQMPKRYWQYLTEKKAL